MAPAGLRSRLSGSVPVSIVVHLVLLLVLVVIPLMDIALPIPAGMMPSYVLAAPLPPPPGAVPRPAPSPTSARVATPVPRNAPDEILPERSSPDSFTPLGTIEEGPPAAFGVIGDVGPPAAPPQVPPDPPAPPAGPVRVAELPQAPRKVVDVRPVYPEIARSARVDGTVVLEAILDPTGRVTQLRVITSVPLLDQAALEAVRQWRYAPTTYGGRAVSVLMTITVRFTLQR